MKKYIVLGVVVCFFSALSVCMAAPVVPASTYTETLPQSAFDKGDAFAAVKMLLEANVPVPVIIDTALRNGISQEVVVRALLAAGISAEKIVLFCLQGDISFKSAVAAIDEYGTSPEQVLTWLIKWETGLNGMYETCDFMLKNGRTKADLLRTLAEAEADRELVVQVVRWFDIPPATVISVFQEFLDYFGHIFNREGLPNPALLAIGVARIPIEECIDCRPVISPMRP